MKRWIRKTDPRMRLGCSKRDALWCHVGGGCWLVDLPGRKRHPCDDTYEHVRTGRTVQFYTTKAAHYRMPAYLRSLRDVTKIEGVRRAPTKRRPTKIRPTKRRPR